MSDDLIKRSDAIKAIDELPNAYNGWSDAYDKAYIISTLEEVPSADRPQGRNLSEEYPSLFECSVCGTSCFDTIPWDCDINYCPNCGARMKGADDE